MRTMPTIDEHMEQMQRPDSHLPRVLKHEDIHEVRDVSSMGQHAFQIVFDRTFLPYAWARNVRREGWEMEYARIEYHDTRGGFFGWLLPNSGCITVVVSMGDPDDPFAGGEAA
jgi:hypothetical protein